MVAQFSQLHDGIEELFVAALCLASLIGHHNTLLLHLTVGLKLNQKAALWRKITTPRMD